MTPYVIRLTDTSGGVDEGVLYTRGGARLGRVWRTQDGRSWFREDSGGWLRDFLAEVLPSTPGLVSDREPLTSAERDTRRAV